jgi:hypothetical protein
LRTHCATLRNSNTTTEADFNPNVNYPGITYPTGRLERRDIPSKQDRLGH